MRRIGVKSFAGAALPIWAALLVFTIMLGAFFPLDAQGASGWNRAADDVSVDKAGQPLAIFYQVMITKNIGIFDDTFSRDGYRAADPGVAESNNEGGDRRFRSNQGMSKASCRCVAPFELRGRREASELRDANALSLPIPKALRRSVADVLKEGRRLPHLIFGGVSIGHKPKRVRDYERSVGHHLRIASNVRLIAAEYRCDRRCQRGHGSDDYGRILPPILLLVGGIAALFRGFWSGTCLRGGLDFDIWR